MGSESFGGKPATARLEQGDAGFLTQAELDKMNDSVPAAEVAPVEKPAIAPLVEKVPASVITPEQRAETIKQIGAQEAKLGENIVATNSVLEKVTKGTTPREDKLKALVESERRTDGIKKAYENIKGKINVLSTAAFMGGLGLMTTGVLSQIASSKYDFAAQSWVGDGSLLDKIGHPAFTAGYDTLFTAAGVFVVGHAVNALTSHIMQRGEEKKRHGISFGGLFGGAKA